MWQSARDVHFDAVLVKPITASALHDTLARVLQLQGTTTRLAPAQLSLGEAQLLQRHAGQRLLLVEDNPINREVAQELLHGVGLVVETAEDGVRAVELATTRPYDLILMDVQMPDMDGLAATRMIRERARRRTAIVAMTANAFGEDRRSCLDAGMDDHVAKPIDPEMLFSTLLRWLPARTDSARSGAPGATPATPGSGPVAPLRERLDGVPGFDAAAALRNLGGNEATLVRVLRRFTDAYRGGAPALAHPIEPDPIAAWLSSCHSLRGACATMGASMLSTLIEAFERELLASQDVPALAVTARLVNEQLIRLVERLAAELEA
jgi:CheY-like chemotaxis protein